MHVVAESVVVYVQATPPVPLQSLRVLEIVDVERNDWLPLLQGALNLRTLHVEGSPDHTAGILSAMDSLPSLQRLCRAGDSNHESLFNLGQIEAALKRQGGELEFTGKPS